MTQRSRWLARVPIVVVLVAATLPTVVIVVQAECSTSCFSSTCDGFGAAAGVSCASLEQLFACDCSDCLCDVDSTYDPSACVDIPGFLDTRGYTCTDYTADPVLCDDAQVYTIAGLLAATEACCACIPETATYAVPVDVQHAVNGDTLSGQFFTTGSLDDSCWLVNTTSVILSLIHI